MNAPERRLNEIIDRLIVKVNDENPHQLLFYEDSVKLMDYNLLSGLLWCSYKNLWASFVKEGLSYDDIRTVISRAMEQRYNITGVEPFSYDKTT